MKKKGLFISVEGTEGSGKSTLIHHFAEALREKRFQVLQTREPGGSPLAETLRNWILEHTMDARTELFLYEAARSEHLHQTLKPALQQGKIVLCDRFTDSTLAYQAQARGLKWETIQQINHFATQGVQPDWTLFLDFPPKQGLQRATDRNRFEAEGIVFQKKVRQGYLKARRQDPVRWYTLYPAQDSPSQMAQQVVQIFLKRFSKKLSRLATLP